MWTSAGGRALTVPKRERRGRRDGEGALVEAYDVACTGVSIAQMRPRMRLSEARGEADATREERESEGDGGHSVRAGRASSYASAKYSHRVYEVGNAKHESRARRELASVRPGASPTRGSSARTRATNAAQKESTAIQKTLDPCSARSTKGARAPAQPSRLW